MQSILPKHYTCKPFKNRIHCCSPQGFDDEEQWNYIRQAIKQKFGQKFTNIAFYGCGNKYFTVSLKLEENPDKIKFITDDSPVKLKEEKIPCKKCNSTTFFVDWKRTRKKYMSSSEPVFIKGINDKTQFHFNTYFKCAECGWKLPTPIKHIPEPTATIKFLNSRSLI